METKNVLDRPTQTSVGLPLYKYVCRLFGQIMCEVCEAGGSSGYKPNDPSPLAPAPACFLMDEEVWRTRSTRDDWVEKRCSRKLAAQEGIAQHYIRGTISLTDVVLNPSLPLAA